MQQLSIGIDLGCTNIKGVLIDRDGTIIEQLREETNEQDDQHWKNAVAVMIKNLKSKSSTAIKTIGLSAPGLANSDNTCISFMPGRLPGLENFNWSEFTGKRIFVLNDAHAALMAEAAFGAARGMQHALLLTLGTGVGGGILINGQLYQGLSQMAGHLGHTTVDADSPAIDVTNMPGSIEDAIGNLSISKRSLGKFNTMADSLNALKINKALQTTQQSIEGLNRIVANLEAGQGSAGKLLKDDSLYTNLSRTMLDLDKLLLDFRLAPKRYIHLSVFGKKNTAPVVK